MNQLTIQFPDDVDFESYWTRLGAIRPAAPQAAPVPVIAPAAPKSEQLIIWQTEESIALRFSFRVPVYTKKGMLKSWDLKCVPLSNCISVEDFADPTAGFHYDANKLAALFMDSMRQRVITKLGLNEEQAKLVEFRGLSVARHLAVTNVPVGDPRWT